ncbi:MAG: flagellar basal body rod protein FlgB [Gammaproteobacteria bacterium]
MNLDNAFGLHAKAMSLRTHRAEVLATNIANAETPNYLARDFDFQQALESAASGRSEMKMTNANHMQSGEAELMGQDLMYRQSEQPSIDGNTVDIQTERAEFTRNSMQYQASVRFLNGKVSGLLSAIKGE